MAKTVWKYPLEITDRQIVALPKGATVLTVQAQRDQPCIWVMLDPDKQAVARVFWIFGTGHPIDGDPGRFVGTFQIRGGAFVFHVFEETK